MLTDYDLEMANKIAEREGRLPHQVLADFNKFMALAMQEADDDDTR